MATHKKGLKKAKDGDLLDRLSKTKVTDVPGKAKRLGKRVIEKGTKLVSDTVKKVKNTTVGDVAESVASSTPVGMAYNLAKKLSKKKNGGSLSGLKASTKRDKGTDVGGAWTKVQKKTLRGAKGKASLVKDKQLGATKMKKK